MRIPQWAQDLIIRVAIDEAVDDLPAVRWRRSRRAFLSSGYANSWTGQIVVTAGRDRRDQKLVLLHEMAHWLLPPREHHSDAFWDKAWRLFRRYGVPIRYAQSRSAQYRKGAIAAYRRSKEHGP